MTPAPTVKMGNTTIDASNYTVAYSNNTNAGTANFTVTAKSTSTNFTGSKAGTFTIAQAANPISVTATQSWSATYSTSNQDKAFTAATNNQGAVTYTIQSQKDKNGATVSYFTIPTNTTASLRMLANTPVTGSSYTVVIRATAAGNDNYEQGYKDITMTVTVGKANGVGSVTMEGWTYG